MALYYSDQYKQNPIRASLYEALYAPTEQDGIVYGIGRGTLIVPVGTTNGDTLKLTELAVIAPVTSPQKVGIVPTKFTYTTSANAGGALVASLGYAVAGQTAFGSGLTTLQSAATTTITDAVLNAAPLVITVDTLQFLITGGGPSITLCTVLFQFLYTVNAPFGP